MAEDYRQYLQPQVVSRLANMELRARLVVTAPDGKQVEAAAGLNDGAGILAVLVAQPQLWWPNGYGAQPLYDVVVVLEGESLSGDAAVVTSALPLTDQEQAQVQSDVIARLGSTAPVAFKVDPAILGGLIIRVGDKVIDGSVAGQLENLRVNLK